MGNFNKKTSDFIAFQLILILLNHGAEKSVFGDFGRLGKG